MAEHSQIPHDGELAGTAVAGRSAARMAPLWLLLVGRAEVHRHWYLLLAAGVVSALLGVVVVIDSLDGALHVPDRWFGVLLLAEGLGSLIVAATTIGAARRLRLAEGLLLLMMAGLIVAATRHSAFLLAMIFGTAFLVDGVVRIVIAHLFKFPGWRIAVALGALGVAFGLFHLQPWPTWYAGTVGYCIGMFLMLNGARFAFVGLQARLTAPDLAAAAASSGSGALTVYVWTPTGRASTPARQRLVRRYVASVNSRGAISTGHAALALGDELYVSHYPAVELDRSVSNLRSTLRAGRENDVPGRFLSSHEAEVADWCEPTVAVTLSGIDAERLRAFWESYRQDPTYNFTGRNCSTAVARALDAAAEGAFARSGRPWRRLAKSATIPEFWAAVALRSGAAGMTWTPGLILDYSRALSVLVDPVSPTPSMDWKSVGQQLLRNWRTRSAAGLARIVRRRPAPQAGPKEA